MWLDTLKLTDLNLCAKVKQIITHYDVSTSITIQISDCEDEFTYLKQVDGVGLLTLGAAFLLDKLKEELTDEETSLLKSNIDDGLQPLEAQLAKQREFAESAEKIIDRQFEVIALPALEEGKQVVHAYHALSRYVILVDIQHLSNRPITSQQHQTGPC
jgi:hypothetical protein